MVEKRTTFEIKISARNFKILIFAFVSFVSVWCNLNLSSCSLKIILKIDSVWANLDKVSSLSRVYIKKWLLFSFHFFTSFLCLMYKLLWGFRNLHILCDLIYALLTLTAVRMTRQSKALSPGLTTELLIFFCQQFYFSNPTLQ